jgi:ABC-type multidrug transport system fused ATPase/permease subunit
MFGKNKKTTVTQDTTHNATHNAKCDGESWWSRFLKFSRLSHGKCSKDLDGYNRELFVQIFAFWKLFLIIFFLLLIGLANLPSAEYREKAVKYMRENRTNFIYEFLLLFAAFFLSTIFMYFFRLVTMPKGIWTIPLITFILFIFCILKHLSFELSGLYRFNFGSKICKHEKERKKKLSNKERENEEEKERIKKEEEMKMTDEEKKKKHEEMEKKKESMTKEEREKVEEEEEIKNCKCEDGFFTGLFWNGLGNYGMFLTAILFIFFGMSALNPNGWTKSLFNYEFSRYQSLGFIVIGIGLPFAFGCLMNNTIAGMDEFTGMKNCPKNEPYIFTMIKNGCACVSIAFMSFVTFLLPVALFCWLRGYSLDHIYTKAKYNDKSETDDVGFFHTEGLKAITDTNRSDALIYNYSCRYKSGFNLLRFFLILIESLIIYAIFVAAEAGIKYFRSEEDILEEIKTKEFWIHTMPTLFGVIAIQILLEYTDWFKGHLFDPDVAPVKRCDGHAQPEVGPAEQQVQIGHAG